MAADLPTRHDASDRHDGHDDVAAIDWGAVDVPAASDGTDATDLPTPSDVPDHRDLLTERESLDLDPTRAGVAVSDLHRDRLVPATAADHRAVADAWHADHRPEAWVGDVNPSWLSDAQRGAVGHTENCADCARSVQRTWEGHPTAAAEITPEGLPLAEDVRPGGGQGGEDLAYTEQWAGRHAEGATYDEIGQRVADSRGSAIVFGHGEGGHAFNALWDPDHHAVRWVDGQTGEVGDWPPGHLTERFPHTRAIFFPEPRRDR